MAAPVRSIWLDRFLPGSIATATEDVRRRARILVGFCLALGAAGVMFVLLTAFAYRLPLVASVTLVATLLTFTSPVVFRFTGSSSLAAHCVCAAIVFPTCVIAGAVEGLTSPALCWLAVAPLVAAVLATRTVAIVWSFVAVLSLGAMFLLERLRLLPNVELDVAVRRAASGMSFATLIVVVLAWVLINEALRARAHRELQLIREQAMLSERLAALGTLAAGVAHEINNPLAYVLGNAQLAEEALREGAPLDDARRVELRSYVDEIAEGSARVRDIVTDLRTFARSEDDGARHTEVWPVIDSCIRLLGFQLRKRARVVRDVQRVPAVGTAPSRLSQVLVNLLANASHAMPDRFVEENEIRIATRATRPGEVLIEISDNGVGIPPAIRERIFDPFFTTRGEHGGTGLGLPICHAIVTTVGGRIELETEVGRGTTFRVFLPEASEAPLVVAPPAPLASLPRDEATSRPRVLIVDDEPTVCSMAERALEADYDVVSFFDPLSALDRLLTGEGEWDVVLLDVMMPVLRGDELLARAAARYPDLARRAIFMTGGTLQDRAELTRDGARLLLKPFDLTQLRKLVRHVADTQQQRRAAG